MTDERVMTEDEIETMAWDLEVAMMEIRKDPRAALTAGLAGVRTTMLAEYEADMAKRKADLAKADAEFLAKVEAVSPPRWRRSRQNSRRSCAPKWRLSRRNSPS